MYRQLELCVHFNNRAFTGAGNTGVGEFNMWGNSLPAEHLPPPGTVIGPRGIPFHLAAPFPHGDNIRCAGQFVDLPPGGYDWIHLLAASERRTEDAVALHFAGGAVDFEPLRVSDFWTGAQPWFGESLALRTPVMHYRRHVQQDMPGQLWAQRVAVTRQEELVGLRLPRNVAIHLFALTLQETPEQEGT